MSDTSPPNLSSFTQGREELEKSKPTRLLINASTLGRTTAHRLDMRFFLWVPNTFSQKADGRLPSPILGAKHPSTEPNLTPLSCSLIPFLFVHGYIIPPNLLPETRAFQ